MGKITKGGITSGEDTPKEDTFLTDKQKRLPPDLKRKIIESKKSGAGYSGDENYNK